MPSCQRLIAHNRRVLEQGLELVERLDADDYAAPPAGRARFGAGCHFRHILDFYTAFLDGLEEGRVDYDRRERDPRTEREPVHAARLLRAAARRLEQLVPEGSGRDVTVKLDAPGREDDPSAWNRSTLGRELSFLLSHTIHHFASIAWILEGRGIETDAAFGVAPSTLRHWESARAEAPAAAE